MSSLELPSEWFPDILSRLPVKDLRRFRLISRSWRSLIRSSYFIKLHLSRSQKTRSNLFLLSQKSCCLTLLDFHSLEKFPDLMQPMSEESLIRTKIIGSCNGLVALCSRNQFLSFQFISLWNPFTRKLRRISSPKMKIPKPANGPSITVDVYGFGYDPKTDDYKLFRSGHSSTDIPGPPFHISRCEVFSLNYNTWKRVFCPFYFYFMYEPPSEVLVNNALHWVLSSIFVRIYRFSSRIVAFDLVAEKFCLIPHPENKSDDEMRLGVLGCCLSMSSHKCKDQVDVWVMKEYGVKDSWFKLFSLSLNKTVLDRVVSPVAYSRDGDKVLLNQFGVLSWYDLRRKEVVDVVKLPEEVCFKFQDPVMCIASLVDIRRGRLSMAN